jgi:hypothetical protein
MLYHRGCCHGDAVDDEDYLSPMQEAINAAFDGKMKTKPHQRYINYQQVKKMYDSAMKAEAQFGEHLDNDDDDDDDGCIDVLTAQSKHVAWKSTLLIMYQISVYRKRGV